MSSGAQDGKAKPAEISWGGISNVSSQRLFVVLTVALRGTLLHTWNYRKCKSVVVVHLVCI